MSCPSPISFTTLWLWSDLETVVAEPLPPYVTCVPCEDAAAPIAAGVIFRV